MLLDLVRPNNLKKLLSCTDHNPFLPFNDYGTLANIDNKYPREFQYVMDALCDPPEDLAFAIETHQIGFPTKNNNHKNLHIGIAAHHAFLVSPYESPENAEYPDLYSPLKGITTLVAFHKTDFITIPSLEVFSDDELFKFLQYFAMHQKISHEYHAPYKLVQRYRQESQQFIEDCRKIVIW